MLGKDWFPTQPETIWGTLDQAAQEHIKEAFAYRETAFDDERMSLFFQRDIETYADHYYAMFRLQRANATFQPHINKYGEFLRISAGSEARTSGTESSATKSGSETDTRNRTEKWTKDGKTIETGITSQTTTGGKTVTDSATQSGTRSGKNTVNETEGSHVDTVTADGSEGTVYNKETEQTAFTGRTSEKTISGSIGTKTIGDADKNFVKDGPQSQETVTHKRQTTDTTRQLGTKIIEEDQSQASKHKEASKAAPLQAVGITRVADTGNGAFHEVRNGSISGLDFSYASQYGETAGEQGTKAKRTERYEGDENIVTSVGSAADNTDTTSYSRDQRTGTDITETKTYNGYSEKDTQNGIEARTKSGGHDVKTESSETRNYGRKEKDTSASSSEQETRTLSGQEKTTENGTVQGSSDGTRTESGTDDGTIADNGSKTTSGSSSGTSSTTVTAKDQKATTNRYTGREGLTPQEALRSALEYLRTNPPCIVWLERMLEHNFIQCFDI